MIENASEFVDKLLAYFSTEVSSELTDGIKSYARRNKFNVAEFERLYNIIQENCAKFPTVQIMAKLWKEQGKHFDNDSSNYNNAISRFKNTGWKDIIIQIQEIRKIQDSRDLTAKEIDVLHDYDDLLYVYRLIDSVSPLVMDADSKDIYLRKVKEDIDNRIPINRSKVKEAIKRRHDQYNEMYQDQEIEAAEKITKTVEDLNNIFGERKKMLEPEPDRVLEINFEEIPI
jgi:hypothetical protein